MHSEAFFLILHMAIHVNNLTEFDIPVKFRFQIQFVTFLRGHPLTPIDPAPVLLSGTHRSAIQAVVVQVCGGIRAVPSWKPRKEHLWHSHFVCEWGCSAPSYPNPAQLS